MLHVMTYLLLFIIQRCQTCCHGSRFCGTGGLSDVRVPVLLKCISAAIGGAGSDSAVILTGNKCPITENEWTDAEGTVGGQSVTGDSETC